MKKKRMQITILCGGIVISLLLLSWILISRFTACSFFTVSFAEWVPIFLTFEVAFVLSYIFLDRSHYYENKTKIFEHILIEMQEAILDLPILLKDQELSLPENTIPSYLRQNLLLYFKRAGGLLELLTTNAETDTIKKILDDVVGILDEYKAIVTDNTIEYDAIKQYRAFAHRQSIIIERKLLEIRVMLYK